MFKQIVNDIMSGENLDTYAAILGVLVLTVYDIFWDVEIQTTLNVILIILSLLIFHGISTRRKLNIISEMFNKPFFTNWDSLKQDVRTSLEDAKNVQILGVAPLGFVREFRNTIIKICKENECQIVILFVDPSSAAMSLISNYFPEQPGDAEALIREIKDIRKILDSNANNLQLKSFNFIPHHIITKITTKKKQKTAFITINSLGNFGGQRISFQITKINEKHLQIYENEMDCFNNISYLIEETYEQSNNEH